LECGILWAAKAEDFTYYNFRYDCTNCIFTMGQLGKEEDGGILDVITILLMDIVCHLLKFLHSYKE
jgi:hypothetical protein